MNIRKVFHAVFWWRKQMFIVHSWRLIDQTSFCWFLICLHILWYLDPTLHWCVLLVSENYQPLECKHLPIRMKYSTKLCNKKEIMFLVIFHFQCLKNCLKRVSIFAACIATCSLKSCFMLFVAALNNVINTFQFLNGRVIVIGTNNSFLWCCFTPIYCTLWTMMSICFPIPFLLNTHTVFHSKNVTILWLDA